MIGIEKESSGTVLEGKHFKTVKKEVVAGKEISRHNHIGKEIIFIVVQGEIEILLDDTEKYILSPGKVLNFNGSHFIKGRAIKDTVIFITLVEE